MRQAEDLLLPERLPDYRAREAGSIDAYLGDLSGGRVIKAHRSGPVFGKESATRHTPRPDTFVFALSSRMRVVAGFISVAWVVSVVAFWVWWISPEHRLGWPGFVINTALLTYVTLLPGYFVITANRLRKVNPDLQIPDLRVAMVVTKAPSEPWTVARTTLTAMLGQQFPHPYDVWLCDEAPTEETTRWCLEHGVYLSTRQDVAEYQRDEWPRRRKCKEGNLAYFYDHWGYRDYDVVAQLDVDHVPTPTYLAEMVRPFADPAIGYVAAPSMCDANASASWAVRGRLYAEGTFHGPHQLGHNQGLAPISVGSHYAVRTAALREIGGLGPELAEDFSTSYLLNVAGWSGAFAIDALAHGDGPDTIGAMVTQEFQWARSLVSVLFDLVPRTVTRLPWRLRLRFSFALGYYPLLALTAALGVVLAPIAAVAAIPWVHVNFGIFALFWIAIAIWPIALVVVVRRAGLLRPYDTPVLSWEQWLYVLIRWPFNAWGVIAATLFKLNPKPLSFKVTPKGESVREPLSMRIAGPFVLLAIALGSAAILAMRTGGPVGYVGLTLLGAVAYAVATTVVTARHAVEASRFSDVSAFKAMQLVRFPMVTTAFAVLIVLTATAAYPAFLLAEV